MVNKDSEKDEERADRSPEHNESTDDTNYDEPFNDAMDHLGNVEGYPTGKPPKFKSLPKPVRIIGYGIIGVIVLIYASYIILSFL